MALRHARESPVEDEGPYLDGRLRLLVRPSEKEAWKKAARREGLELSLWIRRALMRAPENVEKPGRSLELCDALVQLRINSEEKAAHDERARQLDLTLSKWIRSVCNRAASKPPRGF